MDNTNVDKSRRRFLTATATVVGGAGLVAGAVPFIATMAPSAKTKAIGAAAMRSGLCYLEFGIQYTKRLGGANERSITRR